METIKTVTTFQTTSGNPRVGRLVGWVFIPIGLLLLAVGWHLVQQERARVARGVQTTGVVESLVTNHYANPVHTGYRNNSSSTAPMIRYYDAQGHNFLFTATSAGSRPAGYAVGQRVPVYYDPERPYDGHLEGFVAQWLGATITLGAGGVFVGLGLLCLLLLGRRAAS